MPRSLSTATPTMSALDNDVPWGPAIPLFRPDSPVIITARELASLHSMDLDGTCPCCGQSNPCPVALNAHAVCAAAGVYAYVVVSKSSQNSAEVEEPSVEPVNSVDVPKWFDTAEPDAAERLEVLRRVNAANTALLPVIAVQAKSANGTRLPAKGVPIKAANAHKGTISGKAKVSTNNGTHPTKKNAANAVDKANVANSPKSTSTTEPTNATASAVAAKAAKTTIVGKGVDPTKPPEAAQRPNETRPANAVTATEPTNANEASDTAVPTNPAERANGAKGGNSPKGAKASDQAKPAEPAKPTNGAKTSAAAKPANPAKKSNAAKASAAAKTATTAGKTSARKSATTRKSGTAKAATPPAASPTDESSTGAKKPTSGKTPAELGMPFVATHTDAARRARRSS